MRTANHFSETVGQLVLVDVDPVHQRVNRAIAGFPNDRSTGQDSHPPTEPSWRYSRVPSTGPHSQW